MYIPNHLNWNALIQTIFHNSHTVISWNNNVLWVGNSLNGYIHIQASGERYGQCYTTRDPALSRPSLQVWFRLLLITLPPLEDNNCCSSAFGHLSYKEQGKPRGWIHLSPKDKFRSRCPSLKRTHQAVALYASKSGGWEAMQSESASFPPTQSLTLPQILQFIWTDGTLANCLLLACYKMKHGEETKPPYSSSQWVAGVSAKIGILGPSLFISESQDKIFYHAEFHIIMTILHPGSPCQFLKWSVRIFVYLIRFYLINQHNLRL